MSVTFSKSKGLYKDGIRIQCFFKHDVFTSALSVCRHDNGFITLDYHDDNGVHFIEVTDKDVDFLMSCDDSQTAFDYVLSLIPPSENTGTKSESCVIAEPVGVVDSVGEALFNLSITEDELIDLNYLLENIDIDGCYVDFNDERLINSLNSLQLKVNHQLFFNPVGF